MKKLIILLLFLILVTGCNKDNDINKITEFSAGDASCRQETANSDTCTGSCSGITCLNTGSYTVVGTWYNSGNFYDGNWLTYASPNAGTSWTITTKHPKATGATGMLWEVKDYVSQRNVTIPTACWDYNETFVFTRANATTGTTIVNWDCQSGASTWVTLTSDPSVNRPFEEAAHWYKDATVTISSPVNNSLSTSSSVALNWSTTANISNWCAYSLDGGAYNTSICAKPTYLLQQLINESTAWEGLNSGIYSYTTGLVNTSLFTDKDWGTYMIDNSNWLFPIFLYNITLPSGVTEVIYEVKYTSSIGFAARCYNHSNLSDFVGYIDEPPATLKRANYTLNSNCLKDNNILLFIQSMAGPGAEALFYESQFWIKMPNNTYFEQFNVSLTSIADGLHNVTVAVNNTNGNIVSSTHYFSTDNSSPSINIIYPEASFYTTTSHSINYTISEAFSDSCWWTNDSGVTNHTITCGQNVSALTWDSGINTIIVYANDTSGRVGSDTVSFTVFADFEEHSGTSTCYQEFANVTPTCGGNNFTDASQYMCAEWSFFTEEYIIPCEKTYQDWYQAYDGDWSTKAGYSRFNSYNEYRNVIFAFYPIKTSSSHYLTQWQIGDIDASGTKLNVTIDELCWDYAEANDDLLSFIIIYGNTGPYAWIQPMCKYQDSEEGGETDYIVLATRGVNVASPYSLFSEEGMFWVESHAPYILDIKLNTTTSNTSVYTTSTVNGYCNITEPDSEDIYAKYRWYINNTIVKEGMYSSGVTDSLETLLDTLSSSYLSAGSTVTFSCIGTDYEGNTSTWENSTTYLIQNPVIINSSRISPVSPVVTNTLTGYCNATHATGNNIVYNYIWYKNNSLHSSGTTSSTTQGVEYAASTLDTTTFTSGDSFIFSCRAYDTKTYSNWINSSSVVLSNSIQTQLANITPSAPNFDTNLTGQCNISNANGNNITIDSAWFINGIQVQSDILSTPQLTANASYYTGVWSPSYDTCYNYACAGYFNYTFPSNANSNYSIFRMNLIESTRYIPISTCSLNPVQMKIIFNDNSRYNASVWCVNSSGMSLITTFTSLYGYDLEINSLGMYWAKTSRTQNVLVNASTYTGSKIGGDNIIYSCRGQESSYIGDWVNSSTVNVQGPMLNISGYFRNVIAETLSLINLTFYHTNISKNMCIDINHEDYGVNYSCGTGYINVSFDANPFVLRTMNDSTLTKNLTYAAGNQTFYVRFHKLDSLTNFTFNITAFDVGGVYPSGINIYLNQTLQRSVGTFRTSAVSLTTLNDSSTNKMIALVENVIHSEYMKLPKQASVSNASFNLSGGNGQIVDLGDGSDGALTFTSGTKSYGNLVNNVDYTVSGNTLYLKLNRKYQFTTFKIGPGMTVSTTDIVGAALYILAQDEYHMNGTVNLKNVLQAGDINTIFTVDGNSIADPGVEQAGGGAVTNNDGTISSSSFRIGTYGFGGGGDGGIGWITDYPKGYPGHGAIGSNVSGDPGSASTIILNHPDDWTGVEWDYDWSAGGNAQYALGKGSSGGGGGSAIYIDGIDCYVTANGGRGGIAYGQNGLDGTTTYYGGHYGCGYGANAGGGGGAGGIAGKSGVYMYVKSPKVYQTGTYDLSGTDGGKGGNGGRRKNRDGWFSNGAGGGGGGGGGNSGNLHVYYTTIVDSSTKTLLRGLGGTGGLTYWANYNQWYQTGQSGTNGRNGAYYTYSFSQIEDPYVKVGVLDNTYAWNYTGVFSGNATVNNITTRISTFLANCTQDRDGYCQVPIYFGSTSSGSIYFSALNVTYIYNPNPISISVNNSNAYINVRTGDIDIPIVIESTTAGKIQVSNLYITYNGDNKTYTFLVHTPDYSENNTKNVTFYKSTWNNTFPSKVTSVMLFPSSSTSKNIQPFGQNNRVPIFNISNTGIHNFSFSIIMTNTTDCINITANNAYLKSTGHLLSNTSWVTTNPLISSTGGVWLWSDYACSYAGWNKWTPKWYLRACCSDCDICDDTVVVG